MIYLDPRTHFALVLLSGCASFLYEGTTALYLLYLLSAVFLALCGKSLRALKCTAVFILIQTILSLSSAARIGSFGIVLFLICRMMPPALMGMALLTRSHSAILCAGERMRIPRQIMLMVCILLRFFPVLLLEMRTIGNGIRARSILPHWYDILLHPAMSYECFVLPLMIRALKLSGELACAAEMRGIESSAKRTTVHPVGFHLRDILIFTLFNFYIAGTFIIGGTEWLN